MFLQARSPDWETDGAGWPHRTSSRFVETDDHRWHIQRMGQGPTAVLIHGVGASVHSWAGLAPLLAQQFDVISFDLPGHGFTSTYRYRAPSLPVVADRVSDLLKTLKASPSIMIGHSAGAAIMLQMVSKGAIAPSACISINGALAPFNGAAGLIFPMMAKFLYYNPLTPHLLAQSGHSRRRVEKLIEQTGSHISAEGINQYAVLMRRPGHIAGALGMMAHWDLSAMTEVLQSLATPCMFLAGARDKAVSPDISSVSAKITQKGEYVCMQDNGHLLHEETPAETADYIFDIARRSEII